VRFRARFTAFTSATLKSDSDPFVFQLGSKFKTVRWHYSIIVISCGNHGRWMVYQLLRFVPVSSL
jgi:hypothetical protein